MNAVLKLEIQEVYRDYEKKRYRDFLFSLSDHILFDNDKWICEKRIKSAAQAPHSVTIYFSKTPEKYKDMVKYYAIMRLINGKSVISTSGDVGYMNLFLNFLGNEDITKVNVMTASRFKEYIDSKGYAESTRFTIWSVASSFFHIMNGYDDMDLRNPFYQNLYESHRLIDSKYIPENIAKRLDYIFINNDMQLHLRCVYWLLRLIPSRISEILGMKLDCIKPFDGHFCIFIPSWKQNGGYKEPIMRIIHINDEGMGGYLLSLLREQQIAALSYQDYLPDNKKGSFFTLRGQIKINGRVCFQKRYSVATWTHISYSLKQICKENDIRDEKGLPYSVTTHQFRHNGITDRLRAGFTLTQIAEMTGHHGSAMIFGSYTHLNLFPETFVELREYTTDTDNPYVLFGGKILNMDLITEARLLNNLRSHRVPGGICSDISHCKSDMWNCLECRFFVPEKEQLPYFKDQVVSWQQKADKFKNDEIMSSNFSAVAKRFEKIIVKLESEGVKGYE